MGNTRNHRDVQLVTIDKQRNHLVQELNYHTTKCFLEKVVAIQTNKINVKINKPVYLGLSDMAIKKLICISTGMTIQSQSIEKIVN